MEIEEIVKMTLENLRSFADTDNVVGKPILAADGSVILPIMKVSFGYVVGGGNYSEKSKINPDGINAGVSGAGMTVSPVGFLICGREKRFVSVDKNADNKWSELAKAVINSWHDKEDRV